MAKKHRFSKEQTEEIVKQAKTFWDDADTKQSDFFDTVNEYERLARCLLPQELEDAISEYPDRSALVPPDIYNNLNALRAHIRTALFKKKPYIHLHIAGQENVTSEAIKKAEAVLQSIQDKENDGRGFPSEAIKTIYQALYAGITATFLKWTKRTIRRAIRNMDDFSFVLDKFGDPIFEERVIDEYPESISLDIRRTRIDPSAAERKDIRIVGYHAIMQFSELQRLNRDPNSMYEFDEKELKEKAFQRSKYFEHVKAEAEQYPDKGEENHTYGGKIVEVWSIRGLFRFEKQDGSIEYKDLIVEIGNREVLLALKENTLPLHGWELFDFPSIDQQHGRLYTMGVVEPARDSFVEQWLKQNQSLDSANYNTHATAVGDSSACQELPSYIESGGDQLLKIDLQASGLQSWQHAIGYLQRPPLGQDTFAHSQVLARTVQQTMRMSDFLQGKDPSATETATAVSNIVASGLNLTDELMEQVIDTFLAPVALKKLILWNFFNADQEIKLINKDGTPLLIGMGEIDLPYKATVETNISQTNPARARRFVEVFPAIKDDPWFDPQVSRETLVDILELPNGDRLLASREHQQMIIDRESIALANGIPQQVHPLDNHQAHLEGHAEFIQDQEQRGEQPTNEQMQHIQEHQQFIAEQQAALGNTKELGGNSGNLVQPDAAAQKPSGSGATGNFTPSESRR